MADGEQSLTTKDFPQWLVDHFLRNTQTGAYTRKPQPGALIQPFWQQTPLPCGKPGHRPLRSEVNRSEGGADSIPVPPKWTQDRRQTSALVSKLINCQVGGWGGLLRRYLAQLGVGGAGPVPR